MNKSKNILKVRKPPNKDYWICIIGARDRLKSNNGSDAPMRSAVENAFILLTGKQAKDCYSGWGVSKATLKKILKAWD